MLTKEIFILELLVDCFFLLFLSLVVLDAFELFLFLLFLSLVVLDNSVVPFFSLLSQFQGRSSVSRVFFGSCTSSRKNVMLHLLVETIGLSLLSCISFCLLCFYLQLMKLKQDVGLVMFFCVVCIVSYFFPPSHVISNIR